MQKKRGLCLFLLFFYSPLVMAQKKPLEQKEITSLQKDLKNLDPLEMKALFDLLEKVIPKYENFSFDSILRLFTKLIQEEKKWKVRNTSHLLCFLDIDSDNVQKIQNEGHRLFSFLAKKKDQTDSIQKMTKLLSLGLTPDRLSYLVAMKEENLDTLAFLLSFPKKLPSKFMAFEINLSLVDSGNLLHRAVQDNNPGAARLILQHAPKTFHERDELSFDFTPRKLGQRKEATPEERLEEKGLNPAYHEMRVVFREFKKNLSGKERRHIRLKKEEYRRWKQVSKATQEKQKRDWKAQEKRKREEKNRAFYDHWQ